MDLYESYSIPINPFYLPIKGTVPKKKQYESYTGLYDFWEADIPHRAVDEIVK